MGLDNSSLQKDAEQARGIIRGIGDNAVSEGSRIDRALKGMMAYVGGIFSVQAANQFISSMVRVRGEFQQLEVAFSTMLQSKKRADILMKEAVQFAAVTPFDLQGVASGIKQLLAYGIEAEDAIKTTEMLGNVAAGLSIPLGDLVYLYGTLKSQGRAMLVDIRQFAGRGVPIYEELSKILGVTTAELNEFISAGKVGFPQVEQAFKNMTSEGGQFYNLMREQSKTITGQISNLQDQISGMFNEIGKANEKNIGRAISFASFIVENYEKIGQTLATLVKMYGAYKAAIIATNAVQALAINLANGWTIAELAQYKALVLVEKAQRLLNKTIMMNPFALLASLIVGATIALVKYNKVHDQTEAAIASHNADIEKNNRKYDEQKTAIEGVIACLQDETQTRMQQMAALGMLPEKQQAVIKKYMDEKGAITDVIALQKELNSLQTNEKIIDNRQNLKNLQDLKNQADSYLNEIRSNGYIHSTDNWRPGYTYDFETFRAYLAHYGFDKKLPLDNANRMQEAINFLATRIEEQQSVVDKDDINIVLSSLLGKSKAEIQKIKDAFDAQGMENASDRDKSIYKEVVRMLESMPDDTTYQQALDNAKESWEKAKSELDKINADKDSYTEEQYKKAKESLKSAEKAYKDLGGSVDAKSSAKEIERQEKERARLLEEIATRRTESHQAATDAEIDAMRDGVSKRINEIENERRKTLAAIDEEEKALESRLKDVGEALSDEDRENFQIRRNSANAIADENIRHTEEENAEYIKDLYEELGDIFVAEEEKKLKAIRQRYQEYRKQLKSDLASGNINNVQYDELSGKVNGAEGKEIADYWLNTYGDYYQKREKLVSDWEKRLSNIPVEYQKEARRRMQNELFSFDSAYNGAYKKIFGDVNRMTRAQIKEAIELARSQLDALDEQAAPESFKAISDALKGLREADISFDTMRWESGFDRIAVKLNEIYVLKKKIEEGKSSGLNVDEDIAALERAQSDIKGMLLATGVDSFVSGLQKAADYMKQIAELSGDTELGNMGDQIGALAQNLSAAGEGAASGGWIGAIIGGGMDMINQTFEAFANAELMQQKLISDRKDFVDEMKILSLQIDESDYETIFGTNTLSMASDSYKKAEEALSEYNSAVRKSMSAPEMKKEFNSLGAAVFLPGIGGLAGGLSKSTSNEYLAQLDAYKRGLSELQGMAVNTTHYTGWAKFWGKKDKYMSLYDLAPELWDENGDFNVENAKAFLDTNSQISEEQRKQIQQVIEMKEAYDDAMASVDEYLNGLFGNLSSELTDAIVDGVLNGANAWDAFEDSALSVIDTIGRQMVQEFIVQEYLSQFQERMREAMGTDDPASALADIMTDIYSGLDGVLETGTDAYRQWIEKMKADGYDVSKLMNEERASVTKGIAQASQDSVDELNGRATAIQSHTFSINENLKSLVDISVSMLNRLSAIEINTSRLQEIEHIMGLMRYDINNMAIKGITLRAR